MSLLVFSTTPTKFNGLSIDEIIVEEFFINAADNSKKLILFLKCLNFSFNVSLFLILSSI